MIAKVIPALCGTRTFATGIAYVQKHEHRRALEAVGVSASFGDRVSYASTDEKAAWTHTRGVSSPETAALEMEAVARLSTRCDDPVRHEIIAYAKNEHPTREEMVSDAERLLSALDMADHQYVMSVHTDTDDLHAHIIANRVGPDGRANATWHEKIIAERVCTEIAAERGWTLVVGFHNRDIVQERLGLKEAPAAPKRRMFDREVSRVLGRGELAWQDAARPYVLEAVERASSWDDLRARLDAHGVVLKAVESRGYLCGLAFAEGPAPDAPGCAASRIDVGCKLSTLEERFGRYHAAGVEQRGPAGWRTAETTQEPRPWHERNRPVILDAVDRATSWHDLRNRLSEVWGVAVKGVERGGRLQGLAFSDGFAPNPPGCSASRIDKRCTLRALEARFGPFEEGSPTRGLLSRARAAQTEATQEIVVRETPAPAPGAGAVAPIARGLEVGEDAALRHEGLRARIEREKPAAAPGSWAFDRARGIAENARLREEYGRYRDAFFEQRRAEGGGRPDAWRDELALRRAESERRWEAKQTQRAVVRTLTPRGAVRTLGYGVVEHMHQRRTEHERAQAFARWERATTELRARETQVLAPLRYREYVRERAQAGDDGARRVRGYLDGQARGERAMPHERESPAQPQNDRLVSRTVDEVRAELSERMHSEGQAARTDVSKLMAFEVVRPRYRRIDAALKALDGQGVGYVPLVRENGADTPERLDQVERGMARAAAELREREAQAQSALAADAHERAVAALRDRPYAVLEHELREVERRLVARDAVVSRERTSLESIAQAPLRDAALETRAAREAAIADGEDRATSYTSAEWDRHTAIQRREADWNPLARIGLDKLKRELADGHAKHIENAKRLAASAFDRSSTPEAIAQRCRLANEERSEAQERLDAIPAERKEIAGTLRVVTQAREAVATLEREGIPAPVVALERTHEPDALAKQIAEGIAQARASVGYDKQIARLDAFERTLAERGAALDREKKQLGVVREPRALAAQRDEAWTAFVDETKRGADFSEQELREVGRARMLQDHWNPFTRRDAERTIRDVMDRQGMREHDALEGASRAFKATQAPEIERRYAEQRWEFEEWEKRCAAIAAARTELGRAFHEGRTARNDLARMQQAGVPWQELDRAMEADEPSRIGDVRVQIAAAKDALTLEVSVRGLRGTLESVEQGLARGFDGRERRAASAMLEHLEGVSSDTWSLCVERDMHRVLAAPEHMHGQVREIERGERAQELSRSRERSRERGRGMDLGLDMGM